MNKHAFTEPEINLILLYLLSICPLKLSEAQIVSVLSDLNLLSYFDIKEALYKLEINQYIHAEDSLNGVLFTLTDIGTDIVNELQNTLRIEVRKKIKNYIDFKGHTLKIESEFKGECFKIGHNEYRVTLKVLENISVIFEMTLMVTTREQANAIIRNWPEKAVQIYKEVILNLQ